MKKSDSKNVARRADPGPDQLGDEALDAVRGGIIGEKRFR
jgi:hypothetical protein